MARPRPIIISGGGLQQTVEPSIDTSGLEILGQALNLRRQREAEAARQAQLRTGLLENLGATVPGAENIPTDILSGLAQTQAEGQVEGAPLSRGLLSQVAAPGIKDIAAEQADISEFTGEPSLVTEDQIIQQGIANLPIEERAPVELLAQTESGRDILKKQFAPKTSKDTMIPTPIRLALSQQFGFDIPEETTIGQATDLGIKVNVPKSADDFISTINVKDFTTESIDEFRKTNSFSSLESSPTAIQARADASSKRGIDLATTFRKEFIAASKNFIGIQEAGRKVDTAAAGDSAAGDMAMIFAFMKMLDPTSVVREGEQAQAEQARGVGEGVLNLYNKTVTGEKLTPGQRRDFVSRATDLISDEKIRHQKRVDVYTGLATRNKVRVEDVVLDLSDPDFDVEKLKILQEEKASLLKKAGQ